jgi:hypothetical protein
MTNDPRPLRFTRPNRAAEPIDNPTDPGQQRGIPSSTSSGRLDPARGKPASIADAFEDLLRPLSPRARRRVLLQLTHGYYDGWRPTRQELADVIAVELGILGVDESMARQRMRRRGQVPAEDILTRILNYHRVDISGTIPGGPPPDPR